MRYPQCLRKGDTIGICAPSSGVPETLYPRLDNARKNLEALGYRLVETPSVRKNAKCVSADAATRAEEFMSLYEDPRVRAILPPWGGEFLMDMLPFLDFGRIRSLPPKWICGYSDMTTMTFALTLLCDMATIHGANLMNLGFRNIHEMDRKAFELMTGSEIVQQSGGFYGGFTDYSDISAEPYKLDQKSEWKAMDGKREHIFSGRLIGGCLPVLCKLLGTRFAPVNAFLEKYRDDGFVWTVESTEMCSADIYRTLWQMRQCGWFEHCRGVVFGRLHRYEQRHDFTLEDALKMSFSDLDFPVLYDADIGHVPPQLQIVNGACGTVRFDSGRAELIHRFAE